MSGTGYLDFHCHLDDPVFAENRDEMIADILATGVERMVTAGDAYQKASLEITAAMIRDWAGIFATVGGHPHGADGYDSESEKRMIRLLQQPKVIAIGEIGLDFHYTLSTPENQRRVFRRQVNLARETRMPLVIHSRNAEQEVLDILDREKCRQPVIFHCYTGSAETAREIIARNYSISLSGIITFKKSADLREIAALIPDSQLFIETDSPYLSPEPFRGKTNRPDRVKYVAEAVAQCRGQSVEEINQMVAENLDRLIMGRGG